MYDSKKSNFFKSIYAEGLILFALLFLPLLLSAQKVGIESLAPDSTLSIANKVEIGGTHGDVVLTDDLASITFPATVLPNRPMLQMFTSGINNASRMIFGHSPQFPNYGLQYNDELDQFRFLGNGQHAFSISIITGKGQAALGDVEIHQDYTFNIATNSENRVFNIINNTNTSLTTHGVYAKNEGAGSGAKRGGFFSAVGGTGTNIGMMATASGSALENIAIYGFAIGAGAKAAHFDSGDVVIDDVLMIGTSVKANGYKLNVHGKIISEELRIQDVENWPDYVFAKDYKLVSLEDLEASIESENHLPGIPSAAEVEMNGIDSGQMHKLTMQKIEELTLYIISMNKENQKLRSDVDILKNQIQDLQNK